MDIRNDEGQLKSKDEIKSEAVGKIIDLIYGLDIEDKIILGNQYRQDNYMAILYENTEEVINDVFGKLDPYDLLEMGNYDWDRQSDYFTYNDDSGIEMTDDVWYDIEQEDVASAILEEEITPKVTLEGLKEIIKDYNDTIEEWRKTNTYREKARVLVTKFKNHEATPVELAEFLETLVKTDEIWRLND